MTAFMTGDSTMRKCLSVTAWLIFRATVVFCFQPMLHPFTDFGVQGLRRQALLVSTLMLPNGTQEANLFSVAIAPAAQCQMNLQSDTFT